MTTGRTAPPIRAGDTDQLPRNDFVDALVPFLGKIRRHGGGG
jgi:hypothetical protein